MFTNFYTNRRPIAGRGSNTDGQHPFSQQSVSTDKGSANNSNEQEEVLFRTSEEKSRYTQRTIEYGFGGIWIEDSEEFAKFASASFRAPFERNGEGVCYTGNYFYAYYINNEGVAIPFVQINLNEEQSQELVNKIRQEYDGSIRGVVEQRIDRLAERSRSDTSSSDISNGNNKKTEASARDRYVGSDIFRKGRYFDSPSLYVKGKRTDRDLYREEVADVTTSDSAQSMEAHARGLAEKLGLENVEVVTSLDGLSGEKREAKGWYWCAL